MKKILKANLKFLIGVAVLLLATFVFIQMQTSTKLETGNLDNWNAAPRERRIAAVKILTADDENTELVVACVNKMASLPDARTQTVRDAVEICFLGIKLKSHTNMDSQDE